MIENEYRAALDKCVRTAHENHNCIDEKTYAGIFEAIGMNEAEDRLTRDYLEGIKIKFGKYEGITDDEPVLTQEDGSYLGFYLEELEGLKKYSDEEKALITGRALNDDTDAKKELVNIYLKDVVDIAKLYVYQGVTVEDLIGEGNIGLMMGVDTLGCVDSADEVEGFLGKMIMDAMDAAIASDSDERKELEKVVSRITLIGEKAAELSEDLRRNVTMQELSNETGIDINDIEEAMRLTENKIEGLARPDNVQQDI